MSVHIRRENSVSLCVDSHLQQNENISTNAVQSTNYKRISSLEISNFARSLAWYKVGKLRIRVQSSYNHFFSQDFFQI